MSGFKQVAVAGAIMAACGGALAAEGLYVGGALSQIVYKEEGISDMRPVTIAAVLGNAFHRNFAAELRVGAGVASDTLNRPAYGSSVELQVEHYLGVFGKGILPLSDGISIYGLLGYTSAKLKAKVTAGSAFGSATTTDHSVSYGAGAEVRLSRSTSLGLEWTSLVRADSYDLNAMSLIAKYHF